MTIKKIIHIILSLRGFIQYHYACTKNHYGCKLMGEKRDQSSNISTIIFRNLGELCYREVPVKELLATPQLLANFHPKEALRIGSIALEEFIYEIPKEIRKEKFNHMKNIMLSSIHDISSAKNILLEEEFFKKSTRFESDIVKIPNKNKYSFRLVGGRFNKETYNTTITYTILGKRNGHEKSLHDLIGNNELIEKFHPTEAVKFGFISSGDALFSNA